MKSATQVMMSKQTMSRKILLLISSTLKFFERTAGTGDSEVLSRESSASPALLPPPVTGPLTPPVSRVQVFLENQSST